MAVVILNKNKWSLVRNVLPQTVDKVNAAKPRNLDGGGNPIEISSRRRTHARDYFAKGTDAGAISATLFFRMASLSATTSFASTSRHFASCAPSR